MAWMTKMSCCKHSGRAMQSRWWRSASAWGANLDDRVVGRSAISLLGERPSASNDAYRRHRRVGFDERHDSLTALCHVYDEQFYMARANLHAVIGTFLNKQPIEFFFFGMRVVLCFLDVSCCSVNMYTWVSFVTQDNECFDVDRWTHHQIDNGGSVWTHAQTSGCHGTQSHCCPLPVLEVTRERRGVELCAPLSFCSIFSLISSEVWLHSPLHR